MKEESGEVKPKAVAAKRPTKKKPKDKPKRPLSAYNFFFKEEREKILKVVLAEDPEKEKAENDPASEDFLKEEQLGKLRKEGGKVSFEEMGKLIGQRWKNIDPDRLTRFSELAAEDTERYKKEMVDYNGRQEAKMRSEALKPPPAFAGREMKAGDGRPGYPEGMNGMNFNPAMAAGGGGGGYPYGMEGFSGYGMPGGMPMGMYGYGGYPGMGGQGMAGGGSAEAMARMNSQMQDAAAQQYGGGMYGMGGFQGGMMGYGGQGGGQGHPGQQGDGYDQQQQGPPPPGMDPQGQGGYGGYGQGGGQGGWGQQ